MKCAATRVQGVPPETKNGNRKPSTDGTDGTERLKAATSRQTPVEQIVADLAGTPHSGHRMWRNRPQRGRRRPAAERSSSPSMVFFSKRSQMMAPAKTGNPRFSVEKRGFRCPRGVDSKWCFYETNPNDAAAFVASSPPIGLVRSDSIRANPTMILMQMREIPICRRRSPQPRLRSTLVKASQSGSKWVKVISTIIFYNRMNPIRPDPTRSDQIRVKATV